jgi:hypothetical protein
MSPAAPRGAAIQRARPGPDPGFCISPEGPRRQLTSSPELPPDWKPPAPSAEFVELAMNSPQGPGWEAVSIQIFGGTVTALRHSSHPSLANTLLEVVSARLYSFGFNTDRLTEIRAQRGAVAAELHQLREEATELHCFCSTIHDNDRPSHKKMLMCNGCQTWFHLPCVGLTHTDYVALKKDTEGVWQCGECKRANLSSKS